MFCRVLVSTDARLTYCGTVGIHRIKRIRRKLGLVYVDKLGAVLLSGAAEETIRTWKPATSRLKRNSWMDTMAGQATNRIGKYNFLKEAIRGDKN